MYTNEISISVLGKKEQRNYLPLSVNIYIMQLYSMINNKPCINDKHTQLSLVDSREWTRTISLFVLGKVLETKSHGPLIQRAYHVQMIKEEWKFSFRVALLRFGIYFNEYLVCFCIFSRVYGGHEDERKNQGHYNINFATNI